MLYKLLLRPLFFKIDPEKIHHIVFKLIKFSQAIPGIAAITRAIFIIKSPLLEREVFGIKFPNPVGLAAGFDKDARLFKELSNFGFGFIEIGTITPLAQSGNDKPRMFRLPADSALINRMGFNNEGIEAAIHRLKDKPAGLIVGGNIGKNKITANEDAVLDYEKCFEALYAYVDYFVVNVSSPNTPNLRAVQEKEPLKKLLQHLENLNLAKPKPKPILLKIAPDLSNEQLDDIIEIVNETKIAGVIASNTTISRAELKTNADVVERIGMGGLSGKPLTKRSTEVIQYLHSKSAAAFPIIGVGGIHSAQDALDKLNAGATLVQLYTGFVYEGPALVKAINKKILEKN